MCIIHYFLRNQLSITKIYKEDTETVGLYSGEKQTLDSGAELQGHNFCRIFGFFIHNFSHDFLTKTIKIYLCG
jgi:hypothetical protein